MRRPGNENNPTPASQQKSRRALRAWVRAYGRHLGTNSGGANSGGEFWVPPSKAARKGRKWENRGAGKRMS